MLPRKARTYGTKQPTTAATASKVFGKPSPPKASPTRRTRSQPLVESESGSSSESESEAESESETELAVPLESSSVADEVQDLLAQQLNETHIDDASALSVSEESSGDEPDSGSLEPDTTPVESIVSSRSLDLSALSPLINAYKKDSDIDLELQDWDEILPIECTVEKIAEASFSEVYRISTATATSIIKILPLKVPYDVDSLERTYAQDISDVVPEIRTMNALTVIPGFVTFKGAYLAMGPLAEKFIDAWKTYHSIYDESEFEDPALYGKQATFLAIELGDAGHVLDEFWVSTSDQVWDIFLGVVVALTRAEALHEFEHRDLHENNICIYQHPISPQRRHKRSGPLFGLSGIEITIIDYGLSRARLNEEEVSFKDLEADLELFRGTDGHRQFDAYRRMRTHLFTGLHTHQKSSWHTPSSRSQNNKHTWRDHIPYTNVLWLYYLFKYLEGMLRKNSEDATEYKSFLAMTTGLKKGFDYRTKIGNGAFGSAKEVLDFCLERSWIAWEQIVEIDDEGSFFE